MKLLEFFGATCLISQAAAYYYLVDVQLTGRTPTVNALMVSTDHKFQCKSVPFLISGHTTFFSTGCYDSANYITYPSNDFATTDGTTSVTRVIANGVSYDCELIDQIANNDVTFKCPDDDSGEISNPAPAPPTTTTSSTTTTTTSTTTSTTSSPTKSTTTNSSPTSICTGNSKGKQNGDGYKNDCCLTSADCINSCIKGKCDRPSPVLQLPTNCKKVAQGKKNGSGLTNYCCTSSDDRKESCINGVCGTYSEGSTTTKKATTKSATTKASITKTNITSKIVTYTMRPPMQRKVKERLSLSHCVFY